MAWLLCLLLACATFPLRAIPPDSKPEYPADALPHPWAQTEWWHFHADLKDLQTGAPLHLFVGFLLQRTDLDRVALLPVSRFVNPFHAAYVKLQGEKTWTADRYNFPDLTAAHFRGDGLDLRHGDWRLAWENGVWVLRVSAGPNRLAVRLTPTAAPTYPGEDGIVQLRPGARHHWAQFEALKVDARLERGRQVKWLEGTGFCKHQWGRIYDDDYEAFEWFSLDLPPREQSGEGARSLSIAWLREGEQRGVPSSLAWLSDRQGQVHALATTELHIDPLRTWSSRRSRSHWPTAWRIQGPGTDLMLEVENPRQELWVFPIPIHAGPARAHGTFQGQAIDVPAFVEQAGARIPPYRFLLHSGAP